MKSKYLTEEELREWFIKRVGRLVDAWVEASWCSREEACKGLAGSVLDLLDGTNGLCHFDLVAKIDPVENKELKRQGVDRIRNNTIINKNILLSDEYNRGRMK